LAADELTDRGTVRRLLREAGIRPSKRLGQSFLVDRAVVDAISRIVAEASPRRIVEIGAGLGTVTRALASLAREVVAIEIDRRLVAILERTVGDFDSVTVRHGDVLDYAFGERESAPKALVFGSLPYASTAPILQHLVAHRRSIAAVVLLTQREVARKIEASPGASGSALGVLIRAYADVDLLRRVGRESFHPVPTVESSLWTMRFLERARFSAGPGAFFAVVRTVYGVRRKMLRVALRSLVPRERVGDVLRTAGIEGDVRGETLGFDELDRLAHALEEDESSFGKADSEGEGRRPSGPSPRP
jgi:16S rRNA (adenine1518-N6/adenine1519-N6)-dimethyltransferase